MEEVEEKAVRFMLRKTLCRDHGKKAARFVLGKTLCKNHGSGKRLAIYFSLQVRQGDAAFAAY